MKFDKSTLPVTQKTGSGATLITTEMWKVCPFFAHLALLLVHQRHGEEVT